MKKNAFTLMILTVLTKILGFVRDITLSFYYGASNLSDAYLISLVIPATIFDLIGTGIVTGYIPMYSSIEKEKGVEVADKFTNNISNLVISLCTLIFILGLIFTTPLVKLFASGFEGETLKLAVFFTRITLASIYFYGLTYVYSGYLQLKDNYIAPALMYIPFNLLIIISIVLSVVFGKTLLPVGSLIAVASQFIFLIPFLYKKGYRYSLVLDKRDEYLRKMIYLSIPVIIGVSVTQVNVLVDKTIASRIASGGISALTYAYRLNSFVQAIFVTSIATVIYPVFSKLVANNDLSGLKKSISEVVGAINLLVIPSTIGFMVFAEPIVKLLFGRGAFGSEAISMTSYALFFYSIGMLGYGLRVIITRVFYSLQDTKTPMLNSVIAMVMNIVLNIILSKFMGIGGLALATSISVIFCTVLLFINLKKKVGPLGLKKITISFAKILSASLIMGIVIKLAYKTLMNYTGGNISLIASVCIGALLYFCIIYFMKIEEVDLIVNAVKNKLSPANQK